MQSNEKRKACVSVKELFKSNVCFTRGGEYLSYRYDLLKNCPQMVNEKRFYHLGVDVDASDLAWMLEFMDMGWVDDLCEFEQGFLLGEVIGSGNAVEAMRIIVNARSVHAQMGSIQSMIQADALQFARNNVTGFGNWEGQGLTFWDGLNVGLRADSDELGLTVTTNPVKWTNGTFTRPNPDGSGYTLIVYRPNQLGHHSISNMWSVGWSVFVGEYRELGDNTQEIARGIARDLVITGLATRFRRVPIIGTIADLIEGAIDNYLDRYDRQIREALFNHLDPSVWVSDSRDTVERKLEYAMARVVAQMHLGNITIRNANEIIPPWQGDHRDESRFTIEYTPVLRFLGYDPLLGDFRPFPNRTRTYIYYFYALTEEAHGYLARLTESLMNF